MDILDNAAELFENSLIGFGIDANNTAHCRVTDIIAELAFLFGDQLIYVKKNRNPNAVTERNQKIIAE